MKNLKESLFWPAKIILALVVFLVIWVGMSQLGVYFVGQANNALIFFGIAGVFIGVHIAAKILLLEPRNKK